VYTQSILLIFPSILTTLCRACLVKLSTLKYTLVSVHYYSQTHSPQVFSDLRTSITNFSYPQVVRIVFATRREILHFSAFQNHYSYIFFYEGGNLLQAINNNAAFTEFFTSKC
jgi:hypothetical protein